MKIWNKVKFPLLIALITAVMALLRFCAMAGPSWVDIWLYYPLIAVGLVCGTAVTNILLIVLCAGAVMLVPCELDGGGEKLRRFVLRPVIAVVAMLCVSGLLIRGNDAIEDKLWERRVDASHKPIQAFIQIADEAIWYSNDCHGGYTEEFPELIRPVWAGNRLEHITDTILVDYDGKTVGFAYHQGMYFVLKDIRLSQNFTVPEACNKTNTVALADPGAELKLYFNYKDGSVGNGYDVICITLTMADGTVYGTNDLTDPETGRNYYLSLPTSDEVFERIEDFQERKQ